MNVFKKKTILYTIYGILFGLMFPIISTIIQSLLDYNYISLETIVTIQKSSILMWVIDTAPFFLGLFASFTGIRQDRLNKSLNIIKEDIKAARIIQESFLPELPDYKHAEICYKYLPVESVGGDILTIKVIKKKGMAIFLGDVSGHGVAGALISSLTMVLLNRIVNDYAKDPDDFLTILNNKILQYIPSNLFITALYAFITKTNNNLTFSFSRAGHPHPIIWKKASNTVEIIEINGIVIGFTENTEYISKTINLEKNDRIFLYTDGLIELVKKNNAQTDMEFFAQIIKNINNQGYPLEETLDKITETLKKSYKKNKVEDDILILGIEVK